jgi:hypothetical protein
MVNTRGIDPVTLAAMASPFYPVVLVYLDWPGDEVRVHSGVGTLSWGGHDWAGVGDLGGITLPGEGSHMAQQSATLTIGGGPTDIDDYLRVESQGRAVLIYYGVVTQRAGTTLVGSPFDVFSGEIDGVDDAQEPGSRSITLNITQGPSQRSAGAAVHSYADQQRAFPGDTGGRLANAALARSAVVLKW